LLYYDKENKIHTATWQQNKEVRDVASVVIFSGLAGCEGREEELNKK
jgi:hypothetical protein